MLLIGMEVLVLMMMLYLIIFYMSYKSKLDLEVSSCYECGFDPNSTCRMMFSYRFFLIAILFLIFDVEIVLMLPIPYTLNILSVFIFVIFMLILVIGVLYEYMYGSLNWLK